MWSGRKKKKKGKIARMDGVLGKFLELSRYGQNEFKVSCRE